MYLLLYIEGKTKKHSSKWLEGVDIKYKNKFQHKGCFSLLVLSVRNSNCNTSHISNSQLKIQIIAKHTQPRRVGTAANYKVLHNHYISSTVLR